jgi:DNA-binding transcriptional LysR family regulator
VHLLREAALEDSGIVCLPTLVASDPVLAGKLKVVLPDQQLSSFWLSVFYPANARRAVKLKLFLEMLAQNFTGVPPWDKDLIAEGLLQEAHVE